MFGKKERRAVRIRELGKGNSGFLVTENCVLGLRDPRPDRNYWRDPSRDQAKIGYNKLSS